MGLLTDIHKIAKTAKRELESFEILEEYSQTAVNIIRKYIDPQGTKDLTDVQINENYLNGASFVINDMRQLGHPSAEWMMPEELAERFGQDLTFWPPEIERPYEWDPEYQLDKKWDIDVYHKFSADWDAAIEKEKERKKEVKLYIAADKKAYDYMMNEYYPAVDEYLKEEVDRIKDIWNKLERGEIKNITLEDIQTGALTSLIHTNNLRIMWPYYQRYVHWCIDVINESTLNGTGSDADYDFIMLLCEVFGKLEKIINKEKEQEEFNNKLKEERKVAKAPSAAAAGGVLNYTIPRRNMNFHDFFGIVKDSKYTEEGYNECKTLLEKAHYQAEMLKEVYDYFNELADKAVGKLIATPSKQFDFHEKYDHNPMWFQSGEIRDYAWKEYFKEKK